MLMCERGIRETVTDRKGGISFTMLVNHMNEQRYFHSSFQSFSTQSCNTKNSASPEKQKYINLNYTELRQNAAISLPLGQRPPADTRACAE